MQFNSTWSLLLWETVPKVQGDLSPLELLEICRSYNFDINFTGAFTAQMSRPKPWNAAQALSFFKPEVNLYLKVCLEPRTTNLAPVEFCYKA